MILFCVIPKLLRFVDMSFPLAASLASHRAPRPARSPLAVADDAGRARPKGRSRGAIRLLETLLVLLLIMAGGLALRAALAVIQGLS